MHSPENIIIQKITGKYSLQEVPAEQLKSIADKYPFFGIAQYLLAKKSAINGDEDFQQNAQKASLHFSNALWMHYNLFPNEYQFSENVSDAEEIKNSDADTLTIPPQLNPGEVNTPELEDEQFTNEPAIQNEKIANILKEQLEVFDKPVSNQAEPLIESEPYYKVDYFASQGIKLDAEKVAEDKLTVKLHKFTDWLKQMKRVNPHPIDLGTEESMETLVQNIAENSNETQEVITETMAEVLVKQGKLNKAIELYNKLSFFNPSKNAYFAAKIEELKRV